MGFSQDLFEDSTPADRSPEEAQMAARALADYPHIAELATSARHDGVLGVCDDDFEFRFGLGLILDGLEKARDEATPGSR